MARLAKALSAAAGNAAGDPAYVEDVFSTFLYDGVNSANTITNGIDLDEEGGLVWCKDRNYANPHRLYDTDRGINKYLESSDSAAEGTNTGSGTNHGIDQFNSNGFRIGGQDGAINDASSKYVSWSFRKQTGFFDIVKWTGTGANLTVSHNLGCVPGMIAIKNTGGVHQWVVYHVGTDASNPATKFLVLNDNDAAANANLSKFQQTAPTATNFYVGSNADCNENGETMIAYLFAGTGDSASQIFGDGGDEAIIKTGVFEGAANTTVNLGFEPQWIMFKNTTSASNWQIIDNMRGMPVGFDDQQLMANNNNAESANGLTTITATGFTWLPSAASNDYIYMAIRRGPMKAPSAGTEVYKALAYTGNGNNNDKKDAGFPLDLLYIKSRDSNSQEAWVTRLLGAATATKSLYPSSTADEQTSVYTILGQTDWQTGNGSVRWMNTNTYTYISYMLKRAPKFMDVVCYAGAGGNADVTHNLGVAPELLIVKATDKSESWAVQAAPPAYPKVAFLNTTSPFSANGQFSAAPTATVFKVGNSGNTNESGYNYVAYLFATLPNVSKIGSYAGTAATINIDCGFSSPARFVMIKRTDAGAGPDNWFIFDSVRGISVGNDPWLATNTTAAEVTTNDYISTYASGFTVSATTASGINEQYGAYIFLAIAQEI